MIVFHNLDNNGQHVLEEEKDPLVKNHIPKLVKFSLTNGNQPGTKPTTDDLKIIEPSKKARNKIMDISERGGIHRTSMGHEVNFIAYCIHPKTNVTFILNLESQHDLEITLDSKRVVLPRNGHHFELQEHDSQKSVTDQEELIVTIGQADQSRAEILMAFIANSTKLDTFTIPKLSRPAESHEKVRITSGQIVTSILKINGDEDRENHREILSAAQGPSN